MLITLLKRTSAIALLSAIYATSMAQTIAVGDPQVAIGPGPGELLVLVPGAPPQEIVAPGPNDKTDGSPISRFAQIDNGRIRFERNNVADRIDYWYDTGFVPTTPGPFGCDWFRYNGNVPFGTIVIKIDDFVYASGAAPVGSMLRSTRGTCMMAGYTTPNGYKIPPGTIKVTGTMTYAFNQLGTVSDSVPVPACTGIYAGTPQFGARHNGYTDNYYTTSESGINFALTLGYFNKRVAFRMPERYAGFEVLQRPFERFFIAAPQLEHFYSTTEVESNFVRNFGYTPEGIEGWVFKSQVAGTVPLHRYSRFYPANSDLEHYYSTTLGDPQSFNMNYEHIAGYVCAP